MEAIWTATVHSSSRDGSNELESPKAANKGAGWLAKVDGTVMDCVLSVRQRGETPETGVEGTVRDITEWKRTEEELFEQTRTLAVLDERNRMAREIHDTLAQGFTGVVLQLEAAEQALEDDVDAATDHIGKAKELAKGSLQEARRTVWDLLPAALQGRNIEEVLADEVDRFAARGREEASFSSDGAFDDIPRDVQATLLRICQEALMNARKYARAKQVWVSLVRELTGIRVAVADDGVGFDEESAVAESVLAGGGFGLSSMKQRAQAQKGDLEVETTKGAGTTIRVSIPLA